jgi:linoleate 10R-lipoxygenase
VNLTKISTHADLSGFQCRFYIAENGAKGDQHAKEVAKVLAENPKEAKDIRQYFFEKVSELLDKYTFANVGGKVSNVDIVRDVLKVAPLHWAATEIVCVVFFR